MGEQRYSRGFVVRHSGREGFQHDLYYNKVQHDHQPRGLPIACAQYHDLLQGHPACDSRHLFTTTEDKEHDCRCDVHLYPANSHAQFCNKMRRIGPAQPLLQCQDFEMRPSAANFSNESQWQHIQQPPSQNSLSHRDRAPLCKQTSMCPSTRQSVRALENVMPQHVEDPQSSSPRGPTADVDMWPYLSSRWKGIILPPTPADPVTEGEAYRTRVSSIGFTSALHSPNGLKPDCRSSILQHHGPAADIPPRCDDRKRSDLVQSGILRSKDRDTSDPSLPNYDSDHLQLLQRDSKSVREDDASPLAPALNGNLAGQAFDPILLPQEWPPGDFDYLENWDPFEHGSVAGVPDRQTVQDHGLRSLYSSITGLSGLDALDQVKLDRVDSLSALGTNHSQLGNAFRPSGFVPSSSISFSGLFYDSTTNMGSPTHTTHLEISTRPDNRSSHRDTGKDGFLIACKNRGMSYKEIKALGCFEEAESTLRGRYRTLTKPKEERVRKPEWSERDINLLLDSVAYYTRTQHKGGSGRGKVVSGVSRPATRIPWKHVAERMAMRGAYRYGNATVKKKWVEIVGPPYG